MIMIMITKTTSIFITAHKTTEGMMTLFSCQFVMVTGLVFTVGRLVTVGYRYKHGRSQYFHVTFGKFLRFLSKSKYWNLYRRDKMTCMEYKNTKYFVWLNHYSSAIPYPSFFIVITRKTTQCMPVTVYVFITTVLRNLIECPSTMPCLPGSVCLFLQICCYTHTTQAEALFTASLPEHEGSVSIEGENQTCRSLVEAALRCDPSAGCTGIWYLDDGQNKYCQSAVCSEVPGKPNHVFGQSGLFFLTTGIFKTGKTMI